MTEFISYVVQGIPLLGSALALRAVDLPAEIKAVVVAVGGVAGAFALGWVLVRKTPVGRIL